MRIDRGASSGPVMKGACVIGVNSTGMDFGDDAISGITPVAFLQDLKVPFGDTMVSIPELAEAVCCLLRIKTHFSI